MASGGGMPRGWRRPAAALAVVVAAGAVWLGWWARASVPGRAVHASVAPLATSPAAPDPAPSATPSSVVVGRAASPRRAKMVPAVGLEAAAEYRRRARYPRWAQPLAPDEPDPIVRDREISPVEARGRDGVEPTLVVFPAAMSFETPEPAVVFARLTTRGRPAPAREIRGTLTTEALTPIGEVVFHDDGLDGDAVPGDGTYTTVVPGDGLASGLSTSYLVQVRAVLSGEDERKAATSFLYAAPNAQLTGNYRESVVDGSLVVGAEIEVTEAGRFHVEATLYGSDGETKIAWAQVAERFEPGTHWLDLTYYGLLLRERGIDGPYVLRYVALSTTTEMPNAKNRVAENAYRTRSYPAASFTDRPFNDPHLLETDGRHEQAPR